MGCPIVEATRNTNIIGGGESASWVTWTTIRKNGKQIARIQISENQVRSEIENRFPEQKVVQVSSSGKQTVFVLLPLF